VLEKLFVECNGVNGTLSALTEKFGRPSSFKKTPVQNLMGARFFNYEADWNVRDVHVSFGGTDVECSGIIVETTRYQKQMKQQDQDRQRTKPRL
jgi:hypothetical protein